MVTVGTAGWSIPSAVSDEFASEGTHLARFARRLDGVEINTTFYRRHLPRTFVSWASQVPEGFRFAVKLPRIVTHEHGLRHTAVHLATFFSDVAGLGAALGPVLIQLPPSLVFDRRVVVRFLAAVRRHFEGAVVCEPRHPSWASHAADAVLIGPHVGRVAADPPRTAAIERPAAWLGNAGDGAGATVYYRLHGVPRTYWSSHDDAALSRLATQLLSWPAQADVWCMFDNTAANAAISNALRGSEALPHPRRQPH